MDIKTIIKIALIPIAFIGVMALKWFWKDYPDDNAVEECAELVIQNQTGKDFDLTPLSVEKK